MGIMVFSVLWAKQDFYHQPLGMHLAERSSEKGTASHTVELGLIVLKKWTLRELHEVQQGLRGSSNSH